MAGEMLRDRKIAHDCRGPDHSSNLISFLLPGEGSLFTRGGWSRRNRATGLNLSRVSAPPREPLFPHGCEDEDKVPEEPSPGPPRPFLHRTQQSHSYHRSLRSHEIWLLPWWPVLLTSGFTTSSHEGHPSILGTFQCLPPSEPL